MNRRESHAVEVGVVFPDIQVRHQRNVRKEPLEPGRIARDLARQLLEVVQPVLGFAVLVLVAQMVFVEEVAEVLDQFADLVLVDVLSSAFEAFCERRPDRLRLRAEEPAQRVAAVLRTSVKTASELLPVAFRTLLADTGEELHQPQERQLVHRIDHQAEIGENVLHVNLLEDADTGRDPVGNLHPRERHLYVDGLEMAAVEDGDVAVAVAEVVHLVHDLQDLVRLRLAVVDLVEIRLLALSAAERPQRLLELVRRVAHHHVRDIEDAGDGTVVAFEFEKTGVGVCRA